MTEKTLYTIHGIKELSRLHSISFKKYWGQNFLYSKPMCEKIVDEIFFLHDEYSHVNENKDILSPPNFWEIGPGMGSLSLPLLKRGVSLHLFEIDHGMIRILEENFSQEITDKQLSISGGDAIKTVIQYANNTNNAPDIIYGNLPYSTGARIILSICNEPLCRVPMCIMLQTEAVERFAASVGSKVYGISSVLVQSIYQVKIRFPVHSTCFYPSPNVSSTICTLHPRKENIDICFTTFGILQQLVRAAFSQRRKTLRNTLVPYLRGKNILNHNELLASCGIDITLRAENISPQTYVALALAIENTTAS